MAKKKPKLSSVNRFNQSWRPEVPVSPGEDHGWKDHFRNAPHEVIGYLESVAVLNASRLVFSHVDTITAGCADFVTKEPLYAKRVVEYALAFLEELGIIARVHEMEYVDPHGNHSERHGYVVAPHAECCMLDDGRCTFWYGAVKGLGVGGPEFHQHATPGKPVHIIGVKFHPRSQAEDARMLAEILEKMKNGESPK